MAAQYQALFRGSTPSDYQIGTNYLEPRRMFISKHVLKIKKPRQMDVT